MFKELNFMSFHAKRRLVSLGVFLVSIFFALSHFSDFSWGDFWALIAGGLMVLYVIWFADDIVTTSTLGNSPIIIDKPTPPGFIEFFGWILLILLLFVSIFWSIKLCKNALNVK